MQKYLLNDLVEFHSDRFHPAVLVNEPGYRMVLISMLAGQLLPEHSAPGRATIYTVRGHVRFFSGDVPCELRAGEVLRLDASVRHRAHALEDSVLLVLATGLRVSDGMPSDHSEELDLREVARPLRHPMIFAKFDALTLGESLRLLNDHDPIPLNRQFDVARPGQARWEYLERGPDLFRIRITRIAPSSALDVKVEAADQRVQIQGAQIQPSGNETT